VISLAPRPGRGRDVDFTTFGLKLSAREVLAEALKFHPASDRGHETTTPSVPPA